MPPRKTRRPRPRAQRTPAQVLAAADAAIAAAKAGKARKQAVADALRKVRVDAALASGPPSRTLPAVLPPGITEKEKAYLLAGVNRHPELAKANVVTWLGPRRLLVEGSAPGPLE